MKKRIALPIILGILILLSSFFVTTIKSEKNVIENNQLRSNTITNGSPALDWTLKEVITDQSITFSSFAGKIIVMDFFTLYYSSYDLVTIELAKLRSAYSESKLIIMSIDIDPIADQESEIEDYVGNDNLWYYFLDSDLEVQEYYDVTETPTLYIIDQDQEVYFSRVGLVEYEYLSGKVDDLIAAANTNTPTPQGEMPEWLKNNWYWFIVGGVFFVVVIGLIIQRQRIVKHNRKVQQQREERRARNRRMRER